MALTSGDILRVTARMRNSVVGDVVNVYYLRANADSTDDDAAVMSAIHGWLDDIYSAVAQMSNQNSPYDVKVDVVEKVGGKVTTVRSLGTETWGLTSVPAGTGDAMPQGCTAVINFRTADPRVPGRKYLGTWTDTAANGDTFAGTPAIGLGNAASFMQAIVAVTGAGLVPGVVSTVRDGTFGSGFFPITSAVVNLIVGYMRSRKRGRGS